MTARTGMANLIADLRGLTDAGTADWTSGTVVYWDDDQLQNVLDRNRIDLYFSAINPIAQTVSGGSTVYTEYRAQYVNIESGTAAMYLQDAIGATVPATNYTMDYRRGAFTFTADQGGTIYYLTGRAYDLYGAAADVWSMKAANAAKRFTFSTDNHKVEAGQLVQVYNAQAQYYRSMSMQSTSSIDLTRGDEVTCYDLD